MTVAYWVWSICLNCITCFVWVTMSSEARAFSGWYVPRSSSTLAMLMEACAFTTLHFPTAAAHDIMCTMSCYDSSQAQLRSLRHQHTQEDPEQYSLNGHLWKKRRTQCKQRRQSFETVVRQYAECILQRQNLPAVYLMMGCHLYGKVMICMPTEWCRWGHIHAASDSHCWI